MEPTWKRNYSRYKTVLLGALDRYQKKADVKVYLEVILSLVTISIFSVFALKPTLTTIAQLLKDIEAKKSTLSKIEEKITQLEQAQINYDRYRADITKLQLAIPASPQPDIFVRQIEGISEKNAKITLLSIEEAPISGGSNPSTSDKPGQFPEGVLTTGVSINGSATLENYKAIHNFFEDIESMLIPVKIDSFAYQTEDQEDGLPQVNLFIKGSILSMKKNSD